MFYNSLSGVPAVSVHAVRFSPAVRFHSVPERVRLYQLMLSGSLLLYASTACRIVSGCIGSRRPALSCCTLPQRAGLCPAVSVHALRLCPAVRFHSVPDHVRLYRFTLSGSARLYASTACRLQCSGDFRRAVPVSDPVNWSTTGCKVRSENVTFRLNLISLYLEL